MHSALPNSLTENLDALGVGWQSASLHVLLSNPEEHRDIARQELGPLGAQDGGRGQFVIPLSSSNGGVLISLRHAMNRLAVQDIAGHVSIDNVATATAPASDKVLEVHGGF